jgi:hypothetical protein
MATPLNKDFDQAYTEENLMPGVAESAANEEASRQQSHADNCTAIAGATFAESPFEKSTSRVYYSEKKRMNVRHFLQASSVIIGNKRHCFSSNSIEFEDKNQSFSF